MARCLQEKAHVSPSAENRAIEGKLCCKDVQTLPYISLAIANKVRPASCRAELNVSGAKGLMVGVLHIGMEGNELDVAACGDRIARASSPAQTTRQPYEKWLRRVRECSETESRCCYWAWTIPP